jgi:hypothetical protein
MTMREKMAKAMEYAHLSDEMNEALFKPDSPASPRDLMLADAALDALMEPTEAMIDAGYDNGSGDQLVEGPDTTFVRMVKAAKDGK